MRPGVNRSGAVLIGVLLAAAGLCFAQPIVTAPRPASPDLPDPLSAFMVPQPPIDTTSPIAPVATFEPGTVAVGESAVYRVVLNVMEQSIDWPDAPPDVEGLTIRQGASAQFLQNVGGSIVPRTTFLYHVTATASGTFVLPTFEVVARGVKVQIPSATLRVVPPGSEPTPPPARILLATGGEEFFVGQDIELELSLPGKQDGTVRTLSQVDVVGDGLIVD